MKNKKVAAFGDNCVDYYRNLDKWYVTGNVVDFGVNMKLQGIPVSVITVAGSDFYGEELRRELDRLKIDISHVKICKGATAYVELELIDGERIYRSFDEGVMKYAKFSEEDIDFAKEHTLVHFGVWGHADDYIEEIHKAGVLTSYDFATEGNAPKTTMLLPHIDFAFFSLEKLDNAAKEFLKEAVAAGAKYAIGTFGKEGSLVWDGREFYHYGIVETRVENTVGAGDSFIAGFMYGILSGETLTKAQERGAALAAKIVGKFTPW